MWGPSSSSWKVSILSDLCLCACSWCVCMWHLHTFYIHFCMVQIFSMCMYWMNGCMYIYTYVCHMYVSMYMHIYIYIYIYIHIILYMYYSYTICLCMICMRLPRTVVICLPACLSACLSACMNVQEQWQKGGVHCTRTCLDGIYVLLPNLFVCMYSWRFHVCLYVCIYIRMYVCVCICMYAFLYACMCDQCVYICAIDFFCMYSSMCGDLRDIIWPQILDLYNLHAW
jgi:hypothetical protein